VKAPLAIIAALAVLCIASAACGQTTAPAGGGITMPELSDVLSAVDKASAPDRRNPGRDWSGPVKMAIVFAGLALLPSVLVMMTSFTRIVIVLGFIRRALTTQTIPPTVALVGLALFLALFTMAPTFSRINQDALQPYLRDKLPFDAACQRGGDLLKEFMLRQTRRSDLAMFTNMAGVPAPKTMADVPLYVAIPAFASSEFRTAFEMGCLLFIPFLVVDLVVSGILLSAGMMMLPPSLVSLPLKIILFVLVDGWTLVSRTLVQSFN
jgi:flagellar biosynthetic protein FliP